MFIDDTPSISTMELRTKAAAFRPNAGWTC